MTEQSRLFQALLDSIGDPLVVVDLEENLLLSNPAARVLVEGDGVRALGEWHGIRFSPAEGQQAIERAASPFARALASNFVDREELYTTLRDGTGAWLSVTACPIRDAEGDVVAAVAVLRDVTEHRRFAAELADKNARLLASEHAKDDALRQLRLAVDELATPILEVWDDVLALPLIGVVDSQRAADMSEHLLSEIARRRARFVIVDVTGVSTIDTTTADHLIRTVRSVELLGAECVVTGIAPSIAITLISIGVDLGSLVTRLTFKQGLAECIRRRETGRSANR
ncbi:RsbR, positive regulator of sigma-B [Labilithrix luteola]|uniref:RsbR, positive regulator of sigma-B n=1 Tax=Labilithrix luteola TaxID=1391654 RepID=A0A0K1Q395_9BACT|nr:PAS domain-containing protein [Labilithrix luteola]AKV00316.1 RsbR, positive regulator of sigma-B [Labilithrix luteola]